MDRIRINFAERSMRRRAESSGPNSRTQEAKRVSDCYWRLKGLYGHHRTTAHGDERWMSGSRDAGRPRETGDRRRRAGGGHRVGKGGGEEGAARESSWYTHVRVYTHCRSRARCSRLVDSGQKRSRSNPCTARSAARRQRHLDPRGHRCDGDQGAVTASAPMHVRSRWRLQMPRREYAAAGAAAVAVERR